MKKLFGKVGIAIVLALSLLFGAITVNSTYHQAVFAIESQTPDQPDTPTPLPEEGDTPSEGENPDTPNPEDPENPEGPDTEGEEGEPGEDGEEGAEDPTTDNLCSQEAGSLSWIVCPTTQLISDAVDAIYNKIEGLLVVQPLTTDNTSPIYIVWQYMRNITNIVFVIFLLVVILSQVTGVGINNYGVKRVLPRLIIAVILVNLSFLICSLAVDVSNIIGASLRDFFLGIQNSMLAESGEFAATADVSIASIVSVILGGGAIAGVAIGFVAGGLGGVFWALVTALIGALIAVVTGLITIAARQALVALLIMIAPLAFVAYLLPNTERWFSQWKNMLSRMLVFYPMFSFLFGASQLAGWALIASAKDGFGVVLGLAVQVFPLFFSWSLMKMSGTVLGSLNNGLRRLAEPVRRTATGWAMEHGERARQNYFANSAMPSARLRSYLDTRRDLRLLDTKNALEIRRNRSLHRVYLKASGIEGRDAKGNMVWDETANKYVRNAKTANYYSTLASTSQLAHKNTLSGYGRYFADRNAQRLTDQHGEAFVDSMAQQFLATNEAQADQEWLLNRFLDAATSQNVNRYEYNRLIKGSAGGLGHNGESSIMGQVIYNSSVIENRRRGEARIIATKFGVSKTQMRGMTFDKAYINDNGYETDEYGTVLEDDQYRLLDQYKDRHKPWQYYIAVHKTTGQEITKAEYDALPDKSTKDAYGEVTVAGKDIYNKVRYFDILNDKGEPVQRVFEDDAGYMKELLRDDIAIGDPINIRYLTEIGVAHAPGETTGSLRRYHSTISNAMNEFKYKEHASEVTPMIGAQSDAGFITSKAQYNIAKLQSFSVATKPNAFFQNDAFSINDLAALINSVGKDDDGSEGTFSYYFPDDDIKNYRNVNGKGLGGLRAIYNELAEQIGWKELEPDEMPTTEEKRNLLKHKIIPKAAAKAAGMLGNRIPQAALDGQKPDTIKALASLTDALIKVNFDNFGLDEQGNVIENPVAFQKRLNPDVDILAAPDSSIFKRNIDQAKRILEKARRGGGNNGGGDGGDDGGDDNGGDNGGSGGGDTPPSGGPSGSPTGHNPHARPSLDILEQRLARNAEARARRTARNSYETVHETVDGYFQFITNYDVLATSLLTYFSETECLQELADELESLIDEYRFDDRSISTQDAISQMTNIHEAEQERIENLERAVNELLDTVNYES